MKFALGFTSVLLLFNIFFFSVSFAQDNGASSGAEAVDVYAVFWPIVPGKTVGDPMFWAKQLKESVGGMFSFGSISKSFNQIEISEKRLVEANKLLQDKDFSNAQKSLDLNKNHRESALKYKKQAIEEKQDALELTNRLVESLEKQEKALAYLATIMPEDQKGKLEEIVKELELQISEAK